MCSDVTLQCTMNLRFILYCTNRVIREDLEKSLLDCSKSSRKTFIVILETTREIRGIDLRRRRRETHNYPTIARFVTLEEKVSRRG